MRVCFARNVDRSPEPRVQLLRVIISQSRFAGFLFALFKNPSLAFSHSTDFHFIIRKSFAKPFCLFRAEAEKKTERLGKVSLPNARCDELVIQQQSMLLFDDETQCALGMLDFHNKRHPEIEILKKINHTTRPEPREQQRDFDL
jgi:hypothetical protein